MCFSPSSQATFAAATDALADAGEWEWCLVLLEELEQHLAKDGGDDDDDDETVSQTAPAAAAASVADGVEGAETVLRVELDEAGVPTTPAAASPAAAAAAPEAASAETLAAYTAAVRACGKGGAGVRAILGVLERMRWAGAAPGEDAYAAAISAFRACGGVWESSEEGSGAGEGAAAVGTAAVTVEQAARALIDHEKDYDGTGWANPFLYRSAAF